MTGQPSWEDGLCTKEFNAAAEHDIDAPLMFLERAVERCNRCAIIAECADWAKATKSQGVYGGAVYSGNGRRNEPVRYAAARHQSLTILAELREQQKTAPGVVRVCKRIECDTEFRAEGHSINKVYCTHNCANLASRARRKAKQLDDRLTTYEQEVSA